MRRRQFLGNSTCGIAGITSGILYSQIFSCSAEEKNQQTYSKPNFLIIVADDAGWADVGYHGSEIKTPHIDRLARQGVELDQFYVYPVCSPTRAALMTGRPPSRYGVLGPLQTWSEPAFPEGTVTLAELLRRHGYDTAISGKWHLGMRPEESPNNFGFSHAYGYTGPWLDSYTHLTTNFRGDMSGVRNWHRNGELIDEEGHVSDLITDEAVRFIRDIRDKTKPFFLYVPYSAPHVPLQEEDRWIKPYRETIDNESRRFFAAAMTHMDDAIGQLISTLTEKQLEKDTLVIFFSDNGGQRGGDYGRNGSGWMIPPAKFNMDYRQPDVLGLGNNKPLRNWKGQLYEGGIRVPALMNWPGLLESRKVTEVMIVHDILPTLAHLSGAHVPEDMHAEGINIWPAVTGGVLSKQRILYWRGGGQLAIRKGAWKLIHKGRTPDTGSNELFNISKDPNETMDIANENQTKVVELHKELARQFSMDKKL